MPHARRCEHLANAVLARRSIAVQQGARADEAKVVKRLDNGGTRRTSPVVARWRDQRECIVEVDHVRSMVSSCGFHSVVPCAAPDRRARQIDFRQICNRVVGHRQTTDIVPVGFQNCLFSLEDAILTTGELVEVVDEKDA
jgi:hypothetical protein